MVKTNDSLQLRRLGIGYSIPSKLRLGDDKFPDISTQNQIDIIIRDGCNSNHFSMRIISFSLTDPPIEKFRTRPYSIAVKVPVTILSSVIETVVVIESGFVTPSPNHPEKMKP